MGEEEDTGADTGPAACVCVCLCLCVHVVCPASMFLAPAHLVCPARMFH